MKKKSGLRTWEVFCSLQSSSLAYISAFAISFCLLAPAFDRCCFSRVAIATGFKSWRDTPLVRTWRGYMQQYLYHWNWVAIWLFQTAPPRLQFCHLALFACEFSNGLQTRFLHCKCLWTQEVKPWSFKVYKRTKNFGLSDLLDSNIR